MASEIWHKKPPADKPAAIIPIHSRGAIHREENDQMVAWGFAGRNPRIPQKVITGRFEMERDGQVASLEYSMTGDVLELIHTEVPNKLRGLGFVSISRERASICP
jgi:hypothetical protein